MIVVSCYKSTTGDDAYLALCLKYNYNLSQINWNAWRKILKYVSYNFIASNVSKYTLVDIITPYFSTSSPSFLSSLFSSSSSILLQIINVLISLVFQKEEYFAVQIAHNVSVFQTLYARTCASSVRDVTCCLYLRAWVWDHIRLFHITEVWTGCTWVTGLVTHTQALCTRTCITCTEIRTVTLSLNLLLHPVWSL